MKTIEVFMKDEGSPPFRENEPARIFWVARIKDEPWLSFMDTTKEGAIGRLLIVHSDRLGVNLVDPAGEH